ncbi:MAG: hypothetical protein KIT80_00170 [Chitinophagaceae bacterium]|nr:hypothetical protein [Chitinophagaceae bacterium]MCW5925305.1 hypothetical protein [Chitinophagaceae bacterium]
MKTKYWLSVFILPVLFSCHKGKDISPGVPTNPASFVALKLKDIQIAGLPSPYYHFEYREDKYISAFNFSGGLLYNMIYTGDNLTSMKCEDGTSPGSINYSYHDNKLSSITVADAGIIYRRVFLRYYPSGQLQKMEWELKLDNGSFAEEQSYTFTYYPDGNVREVLQQYFAAGQLPEATFTDRYENYDNRRNVDGFTLMEPGRLRIPILIPGISLQINNAGRIVRTGGAAVTYEVNYTYTYDNAGKPLTKTGDFVNTSGPDAGQHYELRTTYSYYD